LYQKHRSRSYVIATSWWTVISLHGKPSRKQTSCQNCLFNIFVTVKPTSKSITYVNIINFPPYNKSFKRCTELLNHIFPETSFVVFRGFSSLSRRDMIGGKPQSKGWFSSLVFTKLSIVQLYAALHTYNSGSTDSASKRNTCFDPWPQPPRVYR